MNVSTKFETSHPELFFFFFSWNVRKSTISITISQTLKIQENTGKYCGKVCVGVGDIRNPVKTKDKHIISGLITYTKQETWNLPCFCTSLCTLLFFSDFTLGILLTLTQPRESWQRDDSRMKQQLKLLVATLQRVRPNSPHSARVFNKQTSCRCCPEETYWNRRSVCFNSNTVFMHYISIFAIINLGRLIKPNPTDHLASLPSVQVADHQTAHRPYSRQVTEWMECDVVIHPPPTVYPKAGNGALRDQWAIKYHCQNYSPTIVFTVRDLVHWNYVT